MNQRLVAYLERRGVHDEAYKAHILASPSDLSFELCSANGFDFMVSYFLDGSDRIGYGLIPTNETLKTGNGNRMAIGLIEGDDVICLDIPTGKISLWMIQTGNGESLDVADSFDRFFEMCCPTNA